MNRITNAVLSFFELVEAEGRELRTQAEIMAKRVLLLFFGGLCSSPLRLQEASPFTPPSRRG